MLNYNLTEAGKECRLQLSKVEDIKAENYESARS